MRKSKFSESQIAEILKEAEAGLAVAEVARKHGISAATFYQWRSKYGGMSVSDMQRLRELGAGERALEADVREPEPGARAGEGGAGKKVVTPAQRHEAIGWLQETTAVSERRACRAVRQPRATQRRRRRGRIDKAPEAEARLLDLAHAHPAWGCPKLHQQLRREGHRINHKRTERLYGQHGLALRRRRRRRLSDRVRQPLLQPLRPNQCWSMDFMGDSLADGRAYRTFNVIDDYARDALGSRSTSA